MTKGFAYTASNGKLTFHDTGRTALVVPDSIPVIMLPTEQTVTDHNAVFPDVSKGRAYFHQWTSTYAALVSPQYSLTEHGRAHVTALPGEWSNTTTLMAAPSGCDIFVGQIRVTRTASPSHNWLGSAINKMVPENVWMPLTGSLLLEAHLGFARAMSIYISGGNLVLHQQQSVGAAPGGYGTFGSGEPTYLPFKVSASGGETVHDGTAGWPIYYAGDSAPQYQTSTRTGDDNPPLGPGPIVWWNRASSGSLNYPPSTSDPTNYSSTWQIDLRGHFGRRS